MKIAIFIDNDPAIRHFVHSGALSDLVSNHDAVIAIPPEGHKRVNSDLDEVRSLARTVSIGFPERRRRLWRYWFSIEQMRTPFSRDKLAIWKVRFQMSGTKPSLLFSVLGLPGVYWFTCLTLRWLLSRYKPIEFEAFLDTEKPDILLHPSTFEGHFINEVIDAGRTRKLPSVLVMNSWDNPSVKRAAAGKPDWVVVWGEQTRRHTVEMMGGDPEKVVILGAAQFDVFRKAPRITPKQLREEHGTTEEAPLVLYCGSSAGMDEFAHLQLIDEAIEAKALPAMSILYRPHPWGVRSDVVKHILDAKWKHIKIESSMRDFMNSIVQKTSRGFHMAEYARTHDILSSADAVISPLSTILIEAALHGRPTLCYYPIREPQDAISRTRGGHLRHFKELLETDILLVAKERNEIVPMILKLLDRVKDDSYRAYSKQAVEFFVKTPASSYPGELTALVEKVADLEKANKTATFGFSRLANAQN